ncbi:PP2C family serine/threonine-protein phosphatase [Paenibacillus sp. GCM10027626]|uniref:PP2C family serine/threonine-protein phosphatase n=1 Tax=Paenibacillus sp. GCM10027626 TaxID=3273411 RepID=UPI00363BEF5E
MKVYEAARKSFLKKEAEDAHCVNLAAGVFGVFDGVTPLYEYKDEKGHNGAFIASNLFKDHFNALQHPADPAEQLVQANRLLKKAMIAAEQDLTRKHRLWSTCAAVVAVNGHEAAFAQVGDCMIIARTKAGENVVVTRDSVKGNAERIRKKQAADRARGIFVPDEDYFEVPLHRQAYARWMANTPEGYSVANGMDEMADYIQRGVLDVAGLHYLLLISDGMVYPDQSFEAVLEQVLSIGIERYMLEMENWEKAHDVHPDDKTAVLLEFP